MGDAHHVDTAIGVQHDPAHPGGHGPLQEALGELGVVRKQQVQAGHALERSFPGCRFGPVEGRLGVPAGRPHRDALVTQLSDHATPDGARTTRDQDEVASGSHGRINHAVELTTFGAEHSPSSDCSHDASAQFDPSFRQ